MLSTYIGIANELPDFQIDSDQTAEWNIANNL